MSKRKVSRHFLRRRADANAAKLRGWQRTARSRHNGDRKLKAENLLAARGVGLYDQITVESTGRWDRRYTIYAS